MDYLFHHEFLKSYLVVERKIIQYHGMFEIWKGIFWQLYFKNAEDKETYIEIIFSISVDLVKGPQQYSYYKLYMYTVISKANVKKTIRKIH